MDEMGWEWMRCILGVDDSGMGVHSGMGVG